MTQMVALDGRWYSVSEAISALRAGEPECSHRTVAQMRLDHSTGDPNRTDGMAILYAAFAPSTARLFARRGWALSSEDREDLQQEAFARVWKSIQDYEVERTPLMCWLYLNCEWALGKYLERLSEQRWRMLVERGWEHEELQAFLPVGADHSEQVVLQRRLIRAFAALPDDTKHLLMLRYWDDLSYEEIVEVWKEVREAIITVEAARQRVSRALRAMREAWDGDGGADRQSVA